MASKIKVDTLETVNGSGSITLNNPISGFTSTGIDDNATSTAITIDASEDIEAGTYSSSGATNGIKFNLSSNTGRINISSINSTSDMVNFNTTNGEVGSIQAVGSGTIYSTGGTGGGIKLGGTGAANTLDDYETGTFTPAGTGINTATSVGVYTKVGNVCHTQMWIHANGSTDGTITGLPFTAGNVGSAIAVGTIGYVNGSVTGILSGGQNTSITMYNGTSAGSLANGNQMHCAMTYRTT